MAYFNYYVDYAMGFIKSLLSGKTPGTSIALVGIVSAACKANDVRTYHNIK